MTYCLGLDIGYSNLKIVMGEIDRQPKELLLPAGAGPASKMPTRLSAQEAGSAIHVMQDGEPWVAGVPVDHLENVERELHTDYPSTRSYRALFHAALLKTGRDHIDRLVTGLPVSQYLDVGRREALVDSLKGVHQITSKREVSIEDVVVLPQPVGAYMHLLSASSAEDIDTLEEGLVIVLDPGYYSFDWVAMQGRSLRKGSSGTSQKAMSRVLEEASRLICQEFGHESASNKEKIENTIRMGRDTVLVFGDRVDIRPFMAEAIKSVAPQAMASFRQAMREEDSGADIVLLAGGGGSAYAEAAREVFPRSRIVVPETPVMANAQGFWFYGS